MATTTATAAALPCSTNFQQSPVLYWQALNQELRSLMRRRYTTYKVGGWLQSGNMCSTNEWNRLHPIIENIPGNEDDEDAPADPRLRVSLNEILPTIAGTLSAAAIQTRKELLLQREEAHACDTLVRDTLRLTFGPRLSQQLDDPGFGWDNLDTYQIFDRAETLFGTHGIPDVINLMKSWLLPFNSTPFLGQALQLMEKFQQGSIINAVPAVPLQIGYLVQAASNYPHFLSTYTNYIDKVGNNNINNITYNSMIYSIDESLRAQSSLLIIQPVAAPIYASLNTIPPSTTPRNNFCFLCGIGKHGSQNCVNGLQAKHPNGTFVYNSL